MSVPPEALQKMMAGGGGGAPQPGMMGGPAGAPLQTPQEPEGEQAHAAAVVETAVQLLMSTIPMFGAMSDEAGTVMGCVQKLQKTFGKQDSKELVPAQLQMLMKGMGPGPEQQAMAQQKPPGGMPGM